jgi:hypothetical protein
MGICYMPPRSSIRPENVVIDTVADPLVNY